MNKQSTTDRLAHELYRLRMSLRGCTLTRDEQHTLKLALEALWDEVVIVTRQSEKPFFDSLKDLDKILDKTNE